MKRYPSATIVASFLLLTPAMALQAQQADATGQRSEPIEILVVPVHHANAHAVVKALQSLSVPVAVAATSDTTLILRGGKSELERITTNVLPSIDTPAVSAGAAPDAQFIPVNPEIRKAFMSLVGTVTTSPFTRVAMDESTGLLAVQAEERDVTAIRKLIAKLDRPRKSMSITLFFLRGAIGTEKEPTSQVLPDDLAPIAQTLRSIGLSNITTMAPVLVRVDEDQHFESQSTHRTTGQAPMEILNYRIRGGASAKPGTDIVQVRLSAEMSGRMGSQEEDQGNIGFQIDTTIATKFGDYVLLSSGPSSTAGGDAVALVLRVTAN